MRTGTIESEPTLDWEGDTLVADADTGDTVLFVDSAIDFDDDDAHTRWLVIADSEPLEYVDVDTAANTVTLADPLADDYEADLPVVLWDPSVGAAGAKVQEYRAQVLLADGSGSPTVTIPHTLIPLNGVANLVGASVGIDERRGEWYVDEVYGREAIVDQDSISVPLTRVQLEGAQSVPDSTYSTLTDWGTTAGYEHPDFLGPTIDGTVSFLRSGVYVCVASARFAPNTSGNRRIRFVGLLDGVSDVAMGEVMVEPVDDGPTQTQVVMTWRFAVGDALTAEVYQSSGASLTVQASTAWSSAFSIVRMAE